MNASWVDAGNVGLLVDLYELTMLDAYLAEGFEEEATFSLFVRTLPGRRSFLVACGLESLLGALGELHFSDSAVAYLESLGFMSRRALDYLASFRFTGDVDALAEGTPVFAGEPLLEVTAPLPAAQLIETLAINQIHLQTLVASKAARVVLAARGRSVVDFGLRRAHGVDAGLKSARAAYVAGVAATSNVLAGALYGIPVAGTMAHSYVQAHRDERAALRAFASRFRDAVLLVDTYDTLAGVKNVIDLREELGPGFRVRGVRIDSGDLGRLARRARSLLDDAGLSELEIFASGGLDEDEVDRLVRSGAPIDAFGVGTAMDVSNDEPSLDVAYKLVCYAGVPRYKLSPGKLLPPGRKQVFRQEEDGQASGDILATRDEALPGRPLLAPVMRGGRALGRPSLGEVRRHAAEAIASLPGRLRRLGPPDPPYPVTLSPGLRALLERAGTQILTGADGDEAILARPAEVGPP